MTPRSQRERARTFLCCGVVLFFLSVATLVPGSEAWADRPGKLILFLVVNWSAVALLCARGCALFRDAKRLRPDQTWTQFLQAEFVVLAVVLAALVGFSLLPAGTPEAMMNALHEVETFLKVAGIGHP